MQIVKAKEKICPFMVDYQLEVNDCQATRNKKCIADECMAWDFNLENGRQIDYHYVGMDRVPKYEQVPSKTDGYCKRLGQRN